MVTTLIRFRAVLIRIVSFSRSIIFCDIPNNQQHIYSLFTQTLPDLHWEYVRSHHLSILHSLQCHILSTSSLFISGVTSSFGTPSPKIGQFISSLILSCSDKTTPCPSLICLVGAHLMFFKHQQQHLPLPQPSIAYQCGVEVPTHIDSMQL